MTKIISAKTIASKKAKNEIKALLPNAAKFVKRHVPAIGYVLYIKDVSGNTLGHVFKENGNIVLNQKAVA